MEERFINKEIKADLYVKFWAKFRKEREELEAFLNTTRFRIEPRKYLARSLDFLVEILSLWASSRYKEKQELQQTIFPEGIYYSRKKGETRTTTINSVFALLPARREVWRKRARKFLK